MSSSRTTVGSGNDNGGSFLTTAMCLSAAVVTAAGVTSYAGGSGWWWQKNSKRRSTQNEKDTTKGANLPSSCIYLDYNGTTPIYDFVLDAMMPYLTTHYGNPSSSHCMGKEPRRAINQARASLLKLLGVSVPTPVPSNSNLLSTIWFTGCGTEADNLAIQLAIQCHSTQHKKHIVTSNVEHPAIELYLKHLLDVGVLDDVTFVPVNEDGIVDAKDMINAIKENGETILVTLMLANNESGALQPVKEVSMACRERGVLFHTDAAQAAGKVSLHLENALGNPDMVSIVGHKIGAMKGIGALYVRDGCLDERSRKLPHDHGIMIIGGGQEFNKRAGTENTPSIVGFGVAAEYAQKNLSKNAAHMEQMRSHLLSRLQEELDGVTNIGDDGDENATSPNVRPNGPSDPALRLPNTLSVGFKNVHSGDLLSDIGHSVAASAGATCHGANSVSSVLRAMKIPHEFARGTVRLSLGPTTTRDDIDRASVLISDGVRRQWARQQANNGRKTSDVPVSQ